MDMRKALVVLFLLPIALFGQVLDNTSQQYAMRYVKDHWYLKNGDDLNVIDTDIEWPEALNYERPKSLQAYMAKFLFGEDIANFDSAYHALNVKHGQPVTEQFKELPDDRRYCYITASARVKNHCPGKWIAYVVNYEAKPEKLSRIKPRKETRYFVYEIGRQQVMTPDMVIKQKRIEDGYVEQEFFDTVFAPLDEQDYGDIRSASIEGAWFEKEGKTLGLHISCKTDQTTLGYDVFIPYENVRYLITKSARRLVEKPTLKPNPEYIAPPETWRGEPVYKTVDTMPVFRGGNEGLKSYLANVAPPAEWEGGKVMVSFVVDQDGGVGDIRVVGSLNPVLDRDAASLVRGMPKFTPGKLNGQPVCVRIYTPIQYR